LTLNSALALLLLREQECQQIAEFRWCLDHTFRHGGTVLDLAFRDISLSHYSVNSGGEQQIDFIAGFSSHETGNFLVIFKTHECQRNIGATVLFGVITDSTR